MDINNIADFRLYLLNPLREPSKCSSRASISSDNDAYSLDISEEVKKKSDSFPYSQGSAVADKASSMEAKSKIELASQKYSKSSSFGNYQENTVNIFA